MRRSVGVLLILVVAVAVLFVIRSRGSDPVSPTPTLAARPTDAGRSIVPGSISKLRSALASMKGRPVVVNFWATWCEPCKAEMPRLVDASEEYSDRVGFLGVNVEDDIDAAEQFVRDFEIPFRSVADPNGEIRRDEKVLGLPVTQFYGADGDLAYVHQGEIKADELEKRIEDALRLDT